MPSLPLRQSSVPVLETVIRAETSRPHNAYPKMPVHLENVHYQRLASGPLVPLRKKDGSAHRDWVGSFATEELAQGHAQKRRDGF